MKAILESQRGFHLLSGWILVELLGLRWADQLGSNRRRLRVETGFQSVACPRSRPGTWVSGGISLHRLNDIGLKSPWSVRSKSGCV
ncbi:hypothetical protein F4780DRAFT_729597 [Xylariomycetidae sp. FL0641]|nr:hypothetical protein F4780DRAFT_729597 [Xylariomycetidae sp. FL0641]